MVATLIVPHLGSVTAGTPPPDTTISSEPSAQAVPTTDAVPVATETTLVVDDAPTTTESPASTEPSPTTVPAPDPSVSPTAPDTTDPPVAAAAPGFPEAPEAMASTPGDGQVVLAWHAPDDGGFAIDDYIIEYSVDGTSWTSYADGVSTNTNAAVTGLANGTTYLFHVAAHNVNGAGDATTVSDTPRTVPAAPASLAIAATNVAGQLRLSWVAPDDGGAPITSYAVERWNSGTAEWIAVGTSVGPEFHVDGLDPRRGHSFHVRARNVAGLGPASATVYAVPRGAPSAPRYLAASANNQSGQIRLTWSAPSFYGGAPISYLIQRSVDGITWTTIKRDLTTTGYLITGQMNGTRYHFRVFAQNVAGTSPASTTASASARTNPSPPRALTATATGVLGTVRLTWSAPQSDGGAPLWRYVVQRSPNGISNWVNVPFGDQWEGDYALTVSDLPHGTRSYFRVYARNVVGLSPASNVASAVPTNVLFAPTSLTATPGNRAAFLTWHTPRSDGGSPIIDYVILRSPNGATNWVVVPDRVSSEPRAAVTGLSNGVRYYFRVYARTSRATSQWSNTASAVPRTVPGAPRNLVGSSDPDVDYLRWSPPASNGGAPITGYVVEAWNGSYWERLGTTTSTSARINVSGAGCSDYRVAARNAAGIGPFSYVRVCYP